MTAIKVVTLGDGKRVSLRNYVRAIKLAKSVDPDYVFDRGLTSWWPTKAHEVRQQFREGMHDRINQRGADQ